MKDGRPPREGFRKTLLAAPVVREAAALWGASVLLTLLAAATVPAGTPPSAWLAALAVAFGAALLGARRPDDAAVALALVAPLAPGLSRLLCPGIPLLFFFAFPAVGAALASRRLRPEPSALPRAVLRWGLAFLAVEAASAVSSVLRGETLWRLFHGRVVPHYVNDLWGTSAERSRDAILLFLGDVLLLVALDAFTRLAGDAGRRARLLSAAASGGAIALALVPLGPHVPSVGFSADWRELGRLSGTFTDPNALGVGAALLVAMAISAFLGPGTLTGTRIAAGLVVLLAFPALQASGSRSGLLLLAFGVACALAGLLRARVVPPKLVGIGVAVLLAFAVTLWPLLQRREAGGRGGLLSRLEASLRTGSLAGLTTQRTVFWRGAMDVILEEPLAGCGVGGFVYEFPVRFSARHRPVAFTDNPTNSLLDVAAECGLPALLFALATVLPVLLRAWRAALSGLEQPPVARVAGATLLGLAAASMTGGHLRFPEIGVLTALVAGLLLGTGAPATEGDRDRDRPKAARRFLVALGILASLLAAWPTRAPDAPFRKEPWIGLYSPELRRKMTPQRWMGPVGLRRVEPGETSLNLRLTNGRKDDLPVVVSVMVDGEPRPGVVVPKDASLTLVVGDLVPGEIVRLSAQPTFVPGAVPGGRDDRNLSIMVSLPWGSKYP